MTLPLLSRFPFHDCELYPSASGISSEPTSFHIHFPFPHTATIIPHLYYSNNFLTGFLSPGFAPFYLVWKMLWSWCFEKQIWLHDSLLSNISINPIALKRTTQFPWPFHPSSFTLQVLIHHHLYSSPDWMIFFFFSVLSNPCFLSLETSHMLPQLGFLSPDLCPSPVNTHEKYRLQIICSRMPSLIPLPRLVIPTIKISTSSIFH